MSEVTREDVIALLTDEWHVTGRCWENYGGGEEYCSHELFLTEAEAIQHRDEHHTESADVWGNTEEAARRADALITAFPHLVGSVEITSAEGGYSAPDGPSGDRPEHWTPRVRTVYTVTGPWREAER